MTYQKSNFKSIAKLIEPLVRRHGSPSIVSFSKLFNIWGTLVGENISEKAQPIRIKTIKGGYQNILYLGMTGPYMAELSLQIQDIKEKINSYYSKEVIAQIKLQRLHDTISRNVVTLDSSQNFVNTKNAESIDPIMDIVELEHALTKMKNNVTNSRKKNEIIAD
ncbi:DciA family protein [Paracoccaceae bacterium]|nr:DciA family protein [Paracoccaceae bacterium]